MIVRNQESIRSLAENPDLVAHMHEIRPGRRFYLTYDLKRAPRHVSKVHGKLITQRQEHQLDRSGSASVIAPRYAGDGPRPARAGSRLTLGLWPADQLRAAQIVTAALGWRIFEAYLVEAGGLGDVRLRRCGTSSPGLRAGSAPLPGPRRPPPGTHALIQPVAVLGNSGAAQRRDLRPYTAVDLG